jgi:hypothetical protein
MAQFNFKAYVVALILSGKTEDALALLAKEYRVSVPSFKVGLPKRHRLKAYGCYTAKTQTISVRNSDVVTNPSVVLHEFYHHLRSRAVDGLHRGTEGNADRFATDFIAAFQLVVLGAQKGTQ